MVPCDVALSTPQLLVAQSSGMYSLPDRYS